MKVINKKAGFNFIILEKMEVGISLTGLEAKIVRSGRLDLSNSYAKIIKDEIYLVNANIPYKDNANFNPTRSRKLLLHKKQIIQIEAKIKQKKLTLVPLSVYTKGRLVKVQLALAKSKKKFEKRESIKKKDVEREVERELKKHLH